MCRGACNAFLSLWFWVRFVSLHVKDPSPRSSELLRGYYS